MKQKKRKLVMFSICFFLIMFLTAIKTSAKELVVSIVREDGVSVLIKDGELYYTNGPLRFFLYKESGEDTLYEYALSGDDGAHYSEWTQLEGNSYSLIPDLLNEAQGIWQIKFRKTETVIKEESISQNELGEAKGAGEAVESGGTSTNDNMTGETESEKEMKITESHPYRICFDLNPPNCTLMSEQELSDWSSKDISCRMNLLDDRSGIRSILVKTEAETLYEKDFLQAEEMKEFETELVLNKEAPDADGLKLDITVTDNAGNIQTLTKSYYIDKTKPTMHLFGIVDGLIQKNPVAVLAEARDNHQETVEFIYKTIKTEADGRQFNEEQAVNGLQFERYYQEDGNYYILCYAMDAAGNSSNIEKVSFRIDGTPPRVQLEGVTGGADYQEGRLVSVCVEEAFFEDCRVDINAKRYTPGYEEKVSLPTWRMGGNNSVGSYYFEDDGDYVITVRATDAAGNETGREIRFRVDCHAPSLLIQGLSEKKVTNQPPKLIFRIGELFYDTTQIQCQLIKKSKNGVYVPIGLPEWKLDKGEEEFLLEIKEEGNYALRAVAEDRAGNFTQEQLFFTLDYTPPIIGYLDTLHQKYLKGFRLPADFSTKILDISTVSYKAYLNMRNFLPQEEIKQDGKYILRVEAVDEAGNTAEKTIAFIVDRTAPRIVVNGMRQNGTIDKNEEITLRLYDEEDTFTSVLLDGVEQTLYEENKKAVLTFEEYGEHKVTVNATDPAQNELTQEILMSCKFAASPFENYQVMERTVKQEELPVAPNTVNSWGEMLKKTGVIVIILIFTGVGIIFCKKRLLIRSAD